METKLLLLLSFVVVTFGQTWVSRARVKDHTLYFTNVMQELAYRLERLGWCNLKLSDVRQDVNLQMYSWPVNGTVLYTNGFLVSIQALQVVNMNQMVTSANVSGVITPRASVSGRLFMGDVTMGYDVIAILTGYGEQRYTGAITLNYVNWNFNIAKNLNTAEMTITMNSGTAGGLSTRMNYRPENHITEVLSRNFRPSDTSAGVQTWRETFERILMDIVVNKIDFPEICFTDC